MDKLIYFILFLIIIPFTIGNTGCWQFQDNYKVLLWSVPISPYINEKAQFTLNFVYKDKLMEDLDYADVFVGKGGDVVKKFENIQVKDGFANFSYNFDEARFYEIYVEFKSKTLNESIKLDFPYEVKEIKSKTNYLLILLIFLVGLIFGFMVKRYR